ncbi:hypothetical protein [Flavobacterium ardleyense]|uniref:hypothetical protein n=1 Tax=Flavobacterium ardleyense TaxID=2038737 RepID=UPI00298D36A9|nr:hypothetical protein [Flavobacterium ardleyense]
MLVAFNLCNSQVLDKDFMWLEDNNDGIKQITISKNSRIGIVQRFNKLGQPYYIKNSEFNGKGIIAVWYFHYDSNNQIDKTVFAHSNIGFERHLYRRTDTVVDVFSYYSKYEEEWEKKIRKKSDSFASVGEKDSEHFKQLHIIRDTTSLLKSIGYLELLGRKKYLSKTILLNSKLREIGHKTFTHKRKVDSESTTIYSKNKTQTTFFDKSFGINDVITKVYDDSGKILSESGNFHNVSYKYNGKRLVEKIEFDNGKPRIKVHYIYSDDLLIEKIYEDVKSGSKWRNKYEYNERGKIASKNVIEGNLKGVYVHEYVYW